MAGLSSLSYINIRHQLPTTGIRQQHARLDSAPFKQAEIHTDYKAPANHQAVTQVKVDIDQYQCRKAVGGFLNHEDFARKYGQKGFQDVKAATSKHAQQGWDAAKNAAKKGRVPAIEEAVSLLRSQTIKWPQWDSMVIPSPEFTVTPSRIEGDIDPGHLDTTIDTTATPDFQYTPGSAETYMKDKGFVRQWVTQGYIDVEA